jgi:hypothetical protein
MAAAVPKTDSPNTNPAPVPPSSSPASDYVELKLVQTIINCSRLERRGQQVEQLRIEPGIVFKDHPAGVEVCGGAWSGVVPWANIRVAFRSKSK